MKHLLWFAMCVCCMAATSQTYIGEIHTPDGFQYLKLIVKNDSTQLSFPYELRKEFTYPFAPASGKNLTATVGVDTRTFTITSANNKGLVLETDFTGLPQKVVMKKQLEALEEEAMKKYTGNYVDANGQRAIVYERRGYLHLMSPYAEQTVSMKPVGERQFWSTSGEAAFFKKEKNGCFQNMELENRFGKKAALTRSHDYVVKEDWVMVDGDSIYVNVFVPDIKGEKPACLLLPGGGGQAQMDNAKYEARFFASYGLVAMTFEKTGVGKSGGTGFEQYTFAEKAARYTQLFQYLQNLEATDSKKCGIHGPSEGGRLALMMGINMEGEVAFINATAAPIMSMKEGQLYAVDHYHRNLGVRETEITTILTIWKDYYDGIIAGQIDSIHFGTIRSLRKKYQRAFLPPLSLALPLSPHKEDLLDATVMEKAGQIECPVLLQYGENDQRVNPFRSIQNFYQHSKEGMDITAEVYPRGNHSMMTPEFQICSGYAYDKAKWLKNIGILK